MKTIIIKKEEDLKNLEGKEDTKIVLEIDYISSDGIGYIVLLGEELEDNEHKFEIEVKHETTYDILDLVGVATIYDTKRL